MKLSVIIPFVNEWPQVAFTVQSVQNELERADFEWEVIVINNNCQQAMNQPIRKVNCPNCDHEYVIRRETDRGGKKMESYSKIHSWLKYVEYDGKLSHWNAKNQGVKISTGDILWFCDAHCVVFPDSLIKMAKYYDEHRDKVNGSLHLPLIYMLDKLNRRLIYKPVINVDKALYHYSFTRYRNSEYPYTVPAMSTCGMMITRELFDSLGGWPEELGIYGGGENFINFTLAILGKNKAIFPSYPLIHYADRRGYSFNGSDYARNRMIATYLFGGEEILKKYFPHCKGKPQVKEKWREEILDRCTEQRLHILRQQKIYIEDWWQSFKIEVIK